MSDIALDAEQKPNAFKLVALQPYLDMFRFKGRTARSTFWLHMVMAYIFSYALSAVTMSLFFDMARFEEAVILAENDPAIFQGVMADFSSALLPAMLVSLAAFVALPSMLVRRMHDTGRSGWWAAPYLLISLLGAIVSFVYLPKFMNSVSDQDVEAIKSLVFSGLAIGAVSFVIMVVTIVLAALKGDPEVNRYGAPPPSAIS